MATPIDDATNVRSGTPLLAGLSPDRLARIEAQLGLLEQLGPFVSKVEKRWRDIDATQTRAEGRLGKAAKDAELLQTQFERLTHIIDSAIALKEELARFEGQDETVKTLLARISETGGQIDELGRSVEGVKAQREDVSSGQVQLGERLAMLEERAEALKALNAEVLERSAQIRSHQIQIDAQEQTTIEELATIRTAVRNGLELAESAHQESDTVTERITELRNAVSALDAQIRELQEAWQAIADVGSTANDLESRMNAIAEDARGLAALEKRITDVQALHAQVLEKSDTIEARQGDINAEAAANQKRFESLTADVQRCVENVDVANGAFNSVNSQVEKLSDTLSAWESRFRTLDDSRKSIASVEREADDLSSEMRILSKDYRSLERQSNRIGEIEHEIERLNDSLKEARDQVGIVEQLRSDVATVSREVAELDNASQATNAALEQVQATRAEISVMDSEQNVALSRMAEVQGELKELRSDVTDLTELKPTIEGILEDAEQLSATMSTIEAGRDLLVEMRKRLQELEALGARLGAPEMPSTEAALQPNAELAWRLHVGASVDVSTWEFGAQFRLAGRWKRGLAIWMGPFRFFLGVARRFRGAAVEDIQPDGHLGKEI